MADNIASPAPARPLAAAPPVDEKIQEKRAQRRAWYSAHRVEEIQRAVARNRVNRARKREALAGARAAAYLASTGETYAPESGA